MGYVIDMHYMNKIISLDQEKMAITVQPGILWNDVIRYTNNITILFFILSWWFNISECTWYYI